MENEKLKNDKWKIFGFDPEMNGFAAVTSEAS
jgi:hypothetical protein